MRPRVSGRGGDRQQAIQLTTVHDPRERLNMAWNEVIETDQFDCECDALKNNNMR